MFYHIAMLYASTLVCDFLSECDFGPLQSYNNQRCRNKDAEPSVDRDVISEFQLNSVKALNCIHFGSLETYILRGSIL